MTSSLFADITIFVLSLLVGFEVITKVPATLHTPLMSGSNAIHGVVVIGVMVLAATADSPLGYIIVLIAAVFAAMNVTGGYVVTDRMLEMFRPRPAAIRSQATGPDATAAQPGAGAR
jgi:H+-translocating NAD(P) transhydrogenase subunit alpha